MEKPYQPKTHEEFMRYTNKEILATLQEIRNYIKSVGFSIGIFIIISVLINVFALFGT